MIVTDGEYTIRFDKNGFPKFRMKLETPLDKSHIGSGERQAIKEDPELARALKPRPKDIAQHR